MFLASTKGQALAPLTPQSNSRRNEREEDTGSESEHDSDDLLPPPAPPPPRKRHKQAKDKLAALASQIPEPLAGNGKTNSGLMRQALKIHKVDVWNGLLRDARLAYSLFIFVLLWRTCADCLRQSRSE